jgi:hypothetical protein
MVIKGGELTDWINPPIPRATEISFVCGTFDPGTPRYVSEGEVGGEWKYFFEWRTQKACIDAGSGENPPRFGRPIPHLGIGGVVLIMYSENGMLLI